MSFFRPHLLFLLLALPTALGAIGPAGGLRAQPATFVSVIADLPLMTGLEEDIAAAVVFETDSGRIAQAVASGMVEERSVRKFYADTLPQLGWHLETLNRYRREGEVLALEVAADPGQAGWVNVHFKLTPAAP